MTSRATKYPAAFRKSKFYSLWPLVTDCMQSFGQYFIIFCELPWNSSSGQPTKAENLLLHLIWPWCASCPPGSSSKGGAAVLHRYICNCLWIALLLLRWLLNPHAAYRVGASHFILEVYDWWMYDCFSFETGQNTSANGSKRNSSCSPKISLLFFPLGYS